MDNLEEHQREMRERNAAASKRKHAIAMGKRVLILEVKNQRLRKQKRIVVERSSEHPVTKQSRIRDRTQPSDLEWTFKPTIDVAFTLIDPR